MVSKEEKILLDYMYRLGEGLREFIENNGYKSQDFTFVDIHYSKEFDYIDVGLSEFYESGSTKRTASKSSFGTSAPDYEEKTFGGKK